MRFEIKTVTILMCAALAFALGSCTKKTITPAEDPQPAEVGFTASSQVSVVKSGTNATKPLSDFHSDFGVWGIASHDLNPQYVLWNENSLAQVTRSGETDVYIPTSPAYWFNNYTYNFMALAPYASGATDFNINSSDRTMSFKFNLGNKYSTNLEYDLMGAVAYTEVESTKPTSQNLVFWHLFAKININVSFVNALGEPATGSVSQMRLRNVDAEANYTLSFNADNELDVACISNTAVTTQLTLDSTPASFNILPQDITDFELYLDFLHEGISYSDFKLNLNAAGNPSKYDYNERYNWNIKIGPKEDISFSVDVAQWESEQVGEEIPII